MIGVLSGMQDIWKRIRLGLSTEGLDAGLDGLYLGAEQPHSLLSMVSKSHCARMD